MGAMLINGDNVPTGDGYLRKSSGISDLKQTAFILMNMRKGKFYLSPNMGAAIDAESFTDKVRLEMKLNDAIAALGGMYARVKSIDKIGLKAFVELYCGNEILEFEVAYNGDL